MRRLGLSTARLATQRVTSQRTGYALAALTLLLVYGLFAPSLLHRGAARVASPDAAKKLEARPRQQEAAGGDSSFLYDFGKRTRSLEESTGGATPPPSRNSLLAWLAKRIGRQAAEAAAPPPPPAPPPLSRAQLQQEARERWWWPDGKARTRWPNETAYGDPKDRAGRAAPGERSYYLHWIRKDLAPWATAGGITQEDVRNASALFRGYCAGDVMRFQILRGRLFVDFRTWRTLKGWFPMKLGIGNTSAKGHIPFIIFALLDALRAFPGQIPDVDAVVHTADFPCVKKSPATEDYVRPFELERERPTPMFGYNSAEGFWDIPFPDFTFWGHEHSWLLDAAGGLVVGWPQQADFLRAKYGGLPLAARRPGAAWRGRTQDPEHPDRDALRRRFVACPEQLRAAGREADAALFDSSTPNLTLANACDFRYNVYIESKAYVSNLRLKLVCGSPLLAPQMTYYEWWSRALQPGTHFIQVSAGDDMCDNVVAKIREMDALVAAEAEEAAAAAAGEQTSRAWGTGGAVISADAASEAAEAAEGAASGSARQRRRWQRKLATAAEAAGEAAADRGGPAATPAAKPAHGLTPVQAAAGRGRVAASDAAAPARAQRAMPAAAAVAEAGEAEEGQGGRVTPPERDTWHVHQPTPDSESEDADDGGSITVSEKQAEVQFLEQLRPWGAVLSGKDEVSPNDWRQRRSWGTRMTPTDIGAAAQQLLEGHLQEEDLWPNIWEFLDDHLRMEDVRLYIRDLLREYAALQRFTPFRSEKAACMNWDRMLREFGFPHKRRGNYDEDLLARYYPYLRGRKDIYSCSDERKVPFFWECEAVQDWQPRKRKWRQAEKCNLPWGDAAQAEWERNPIGKGYI